MIVIGQRACQFALRFAVDPMLKTGAAFLNSLRAGHDYRRGLGHAATAEFSMIMGGHDRFGHLAVAKKHEFAHV
jgi:hypothetical protein